MNPIPGGKRQCHGQELTSAQHSDLRQRVSPLSLCGGLLLPTVWPMRPPMRSRPMRRPVLPPTILDPTSRMAQDRLGQRGQTLGWRAINQHICFESLAELEDASEQTHIYCTSTWTKERILKLGPWEKHIEHLAFWATSDRSINGELEDF